MEIVKLHCLGNEYFVVRAEVPYHPLSALASALGGQLQMGNAKGIIILCPGPPGRRRIEFYTLQGIRITPGACALRCAGYALGLGSWELDTCAGIRRVEVRGREIAVWFPSPVYGGEYQIGRDYHGYLVNLVHRYFITFRRDLYELDLHNHGQALDRYFGGVDTIFAREGQGVETRIWQRGGELPGSSTAACAAAATLWRLGRWQVPMEISMPGGLVVMTMDQQGRFVQQAQVEVVETIDLRPA